MLCRAVRYNLVRGVPSSLRNLVARRFIQSEGSNYGPDKQLDGGLNNSEIPNPVEQTGNISQANFSSSLNRHLQNQNQTKSESGNSRKEAQNNEQGQDNLKSDKRNTGSSRKDPLSNDTGAFKGHSDANADWAKKAHDPAARRGFASRAEREEDEGRKEGDASRYGKLPGREDEAPVAEDHLSNISMPELDGQDNDAESQNSLKSNKHTGGSSRKQPLGNDTGAFKRQDGSKNSSQEQQQQPPRRSFSLKNTPRLVIQDSSDSSVECLLDLHNKQPRDSGLSGGRKREMENDTGVLRHKQQDKGVGKEMGNGLFDTRRRGDTTA